MGIGGTGYFTIKHIIENLNGIRRVGIVEEKHTQPIAVYDGERLRYPIEIYQKGENAFLKIEDLPRGYWGTSLLRLLIKYFNKKGINEIIAIGGLTKNFQENEADSIRIVKNKYWRTRLPLREAPKNLRIYGPLAATLLYSEIYRIPALAILAFSTENMIDPIAVSNAIQTINSLYGYNIPTDDLIEAANEIRTMMKEIEEYSEKGDKNIYT